jgi:AraC-like DNA-binding protein
MMTGFGYATHVHIARILGSLPFLAETTAPIKVISYEVGYSRTTEFDRHFRAFIGMTPSEFRSSIAVSLKP